MKTKLFIALLTVGFSFPVLSREVVTLKNGEKNRSEVLTFDKNSIKYKKFTDLRYTKYNIVKSDVLTSMYAHGIMDAVGNKAKESKPVSAEKNNNGRSLSRTTFQIDLIGVLEYGPVFMLEIKTAPIMYLDVHLRYLYAGLLYHAVCTDFFDLDYTVSPLALSAGLGLKFLFGSKTSKPFAGLFYEYGHGYCEKSSDYHGTINRDSRIMLFALQGGYRWRFENRNFVSLGLSFGASSVKDTYKYTVHVDDNYSETGTIPFALLNFTFGFESKK